MKVAVVGTGYVGLVVGACLAETGNDVICADTDAAKIGALQRGETPLYERGLDALVRENLAEGRLAFTTDVGTAVEASDVVFIAVGTPPDEDGSADLSHVLDVARTIGEHMNASKVVITKSTVPVGTAQRVRDAIGAATRTPFHVCANPEFLREGSAVGDFMKPDRVIVGADSEEAAAVVRHLYEPFVRTGNPVMVMDVASAELTKYAANAVLASRVSLMNDLALLCEEVGADVGRVRAGIGADARIGPAYLFPGPGYGGSCLPKDVRALLSTAREFGLEMTVLEAVERANLVHKQRPFDLVSSALGGRVRGKTVAVWGTAFKAETDDVRESAALTVIERLLDASAVVRVHDPKAWRSTERVLGDRVEYASGMYEALDQADALAIMTEWLEYRNPDFQRMKRALKTPAIVDSRNLYDPAKMRALGFRYLSIGRPAVE